MAQVQLPSRSIIPVAGPRRHVQTTKDTRSPDNRDPRGSSRPHGTRRRGDCLKSRRVGPMHGIRRQLELDWARGLMLVLMSLTHLPTWFSAQLGQPFGYVSAAEGFVIISGFLVGAVYTRIAQERGVAAMRGLVWRRAGKIYIAHIGVLLLLLWVIVPFAVSRDAHPITDLASFYFAHPRRALVGGLLLLYEPPLLDILPMYVLFMLASPLVLTAARRHGWGPLFAGSIALWAMAQFDIGHVLYDAVAGTSGLPLPPYPQTGAFVFLGWQLVWMCGLWGGARSLDPRPLRLPSASVPLAAVVALAFFGWRHWACLLYTSPSPRDRQ